MASGKPSLAGMSSSGRDGCNTARLHMRAPTLVIMAAASLSLTACGSIRTVNGIETDTANSFCERRIVTCVVLGSAIVVAAGIGVGLATGAANAGRKDRNGAALAAALRASNPSGGAASASSADNAAAAASTNATSSATSSAPIAATTPGTTTPTTSAGVQ